MFFARADKWDLLIEHKIQLLVIESVFYKKINFFYLKLIFFIFLECFNGLILKKYFNKFSNKKYFKSYNLKRMLNVDLAKHGVVHST